MTLADIKDLWTIARGTVGFSGAELANLINQAALQASRLQLNNIDLAMLEWAKDKILMGKLLDLPPAVGSGWTNYADSPLFAFQEQSVNKPSLLTKTSP